MKGGDETIDWKTHFLSGVVAGYAISGQLKVAAIGGIAAIVPDIDEPRSKIGRPLFFVSVPLNQMFGHRTLTHSVLLAGAVWLALQPLTDWGTVIAAGLFAHILGDMVTGKVNVLYPLPVTWGVSVSRFGYVIIDRVTRIGLVFLLVWMWGKDVYDWVQGFFDVIPGGVIV